MSSTHVGSARRFPRRGHRRRPAITTASRNSVLLLGANVVVGAGAVLLEDRLSDRIGDVTATAYHASARVAADIGWTAVVCLVAVSAVHYAAAALAARVSAGRPLPLRDLITAQLAAAAANRLTPAGLGGAALLGRFFHRRGGLRSAESAAAVSALSVVGGLSDVATFALLIGIGVLAGWPGVGREAPALAARVAGLVPIPTGPLLIGVLAAVTVGLVSLSVPRVRRSTRVRRIGDGMTLFGRTLRSLVRHPTRLVLLCAASGATTLALAAGFASVVILGPAHLPVGDFAALMVGYMVAAAAGSALPTPGGIGAADAAFVGVLVAAQVPVATAVITVLAFRVITFWAPAAVGLVAAHRLRRAGSI